MTTVTCAPGVRGPVGLPDDLAVAVLGRVHDGHVPVTSSGDAGLRLPFQHEHDVSVHVGRHQLLVQPTSRTGPVLPPAVGPGADDVRPVDDDDAHHVSTRESREELGE